MPSTFSVASAAKFRGSEPKYRHSKKRTQIPHLAAMVSFLSISVLSWRSGARPDESLEVDERMGKKPD
jgi:hypothetical protein